MDKNYQATIIGVRSETNSTISRNPRRIGLGRTTLSICLLVLSAVLSACSSATGGINLTSSTSSASAPQQTVAITQAFIQPTATVPQDTATPTTAFTPTATSVPQQAASTSLDPCQLINSQEASTLAGASFGNGEEGSTSGGLKSCTYGSQTSNVFVVDVVQAPDVETAKADKAQFLADLQAKLQELTSEGLIITDLPNFADGAVMANASINTGQTTINGSAIGFLKGTIFFGFSDLVVGSAAPNSAALQSEATTVLGRLP